MSVTCGSGSELGGGDGDGDDGDAEEEKKLSSLYAASPPLDAQQQQQQQQPMSTSHSFSSGSNTNDGSLSKERHKKSPSTVGFPQSLFVEDSNHPTSPQQRRAYRRMSTLMSNGLALLEETQHHDDADDDENVYNRHQNHDRDEDDDDNSEDEPPFLALLRRSAQIVRQRGRLVATAGHNDKTDRTTKLITMAHLAAFSVLGTNVRVGLSRWWLFHSDSDTGDTTTDLLYAALPANVLGCFLMGLWRPVADLQLLHDDDDDDFAVAALPRAWQAWPNHHLAVRTGFCGSLTTLASWNVDLVRLLTSTTEDEENARNDTPQHVMATLLVGYAAGLASALAALYLGQATATWLYRHHHPHLAQEEDMMAFAFSRRTTPTYLTKRRHRHNYNNNSNAAQTSPTTTTSATYNKTPLPDYERRYLAFLLPHEEHKWATKNLAALGDLERWKVSTDEYRIVHNDYEERLLQTLHAIERKLLVEEEEDHDNNYQQESHALTQHERDMAQKEEWDIAALQRFAKCAHGPGVRRGHHHGHHRARLSAAAFPRDSWRTHVWAMLPFVAAVGLVVTFIILDLRDYHASHDFYRKLWLSSLLAPLGTLVRWKLSARNGKLPGAWAWFPMGTFAANLGASALAAMTAGLLDAPRQWSEGVEQGIFAVGAGLAASMSTVSTFVVEGDFLFKSYPHHAKAFYYLVGTLVSGCLLGLAIYIPLKNTGQD